MKIYSYSMNECTLLFLSLAQFFVVISNIYATYSNIVFHLKKMNLVLGPNYIRSSHEQK